MTRKNKADLADRVSRAAETLLADRKQVSFVDVLVVIGWLAGSHVSSWRQGRLDCLEEAMQVDPSCISQAMMLFESWTTGKGLSPCVTDYVARSPSANRCGSAAAAIRPLKSDIERIGSRLIFQRASRRAWRRKRAGLRNWSWSCRSTRSGSAIAAASAAIS